MGIFYVNTQPQTNGDHEVHLEECLRLPKLQHRKLLGTFPTCGAAVDQAQKTYPQSNGCYLCSPECRLA